MKKTPASQSNALPSHFKTLREVKGFIESRTGQQISMSKLYHASAGKLLCRSSDEGWTPEDVIAYMPAAGRGMDTEVTGSGNLAEEKLREEIRKLKAQTEGIQHENAVKAGKYFRKADVWLELAHRSSILYAGLLQSLMAAVPTIARAALTDPTRAEDATRTAIEHALNDGINEFSRPMTLDVETWTQELGEDDLHAD